jgi:colicin import membrane protein
VTPTADSLLPQPPGGMAPGAALALVVHVGLIAALSLSVDWRMRAPEIVSAELWASLPQFAAPKAEEVPAAPAPAPPPAAPAPAPQATPAPAREAQIATERAEKKAREEREATERAERTKKQRELEEQKKREAAEAKKAEDERVARLRDEQMKRMLGSLQGSGSPQASGSAEQDAAPSQDYVNRLIAKLRSNVRFKYEGSGNPAVEIEVHAAAGGTITSRRIVKASGVPEWDEAALRAIDRTGSLPRQADGRVPPSLIVTFRPNE